MGHLWCPFIECYKEYFGSGYMQGLLDYPTFDVKLLKRCLQKTASTVFGSLDPFLMTKFLVTRLTGAEHCDWMQFRQSIRGAIETSDLSIPGLMDIVSNIIGVCPLIVADLKETGKKGSGDRLAVCLFLQLYFSHDCQCLFPFSGLQKRDRWILLHRPVGQNGVPLVPFHP